MSEQRWTLDSLKKAYQQGFLSGLAGQTVSQCPYQNDVLVAAWEAGHVDGDQQQAALQNKKQARYA